VITLGSLFAGIGGLELGLENALRDGGFDVSTIWQCESNPWCRSVLARHWPDAVRHEDVRSLGSDTAAPVDILCGGFPCQDVSVAGSGAGLAGARSGLWFEFARIIRDLAPRIVVVENVAALASRGLDQVLGELSESGHDAVWTCVRASDAGAPHRRERLFIIAWRVADGDGERREREREPQHDELARARGDLANGRGARRRRQGPMADAMRVGSPRSRHGGFACDRAASGDRKAGDAIDGNAGPAEPRLGRIAHGLPAGLDAHRWPVGRDEQQPDGEPPRVTDERGERAQRLKALGNAVVPQVAYVVGCVVADLLRRGVA
jgi:DNA (cytosine-5)-methyltransferase 1